MATEEGVGQWSLMQMGVEKIRRDGGRKDMVRLLPLLTIEGMMDIIVMDVVVLMH
jgi:hypothetical protein